MDWSPERVLSFGPVTHRRVPWSARTDLLWPVRAWRVVVPKTRRRGLNVIQRAVLRLHTAGLHQYEAMGEALGLDPMLVAYVGQELLEMSLVDTQGTPTARGFRLLEQDDLDIEDMQPGWVFQDTYTGRLMPRFVTDLGHADVERDAEGRAWVKGGTKGSPRRHWAFVLRPGEAPSLPPEPLEVIEAARRHRRHEKRLRRAGMDLEGIPAEAIDRISLIEDEPEEYLLLSFLYIPKHADDEDEPWYIADPFGYGASPSLREQLETLRQNSTGGLRDILDRMTGHRREKQRKAWLEMQQLLQDEASDMVARLWPRGEHTDDASVRERLVLAFAERLRIESEHGAGRLVAERIDGIYLKLRQALEQALGQVRALHNPTSAWRKLYQGKLWIPKDATARVLNACAHALGFETPLPQPIATPNPGKVKALCHRHDASSLRPLCSTLVLDAVDHPDHPFARLGADCPKWLAQANEIATSAGALIHGAHRRRTMNDLRQDTDLTVRLCREVLGARSAEPTSVATPKPQGD